MQQNIFRLTSKLTSLKMICKLIHTLKSTQPLVENADVVVIGSGPAGYMCSVRAAQLGLRVICVEKSDKFGGNCMNMGCVASAYLLRCTEYYSMLKNDTSPIKCFSHDPVRINFDQLMLARRDLVNSQTKKVELLLERHKVKTVHGTAKITSPTVITVSRGFQSDIVINTKQIVLATGSCESNIPGVEEDHERIISGMEAMRLRYVPKRMVVIGAGIIGLQVGSVWNRLGTEITVVELGHHIGGYTIDYEIAFEAQKYLTRQGMKFKLNTCVINIEKTPTYLTVKVRPLKQPTTPAEPEEERIECDVVMCAVGRTPYYENLGLEQFDLKYDSFKKIKVNSRLQTTAVPHIYAVGDLIHGPMLANKALHEGLIVGETLVGGPNVLSYSEMPFTISTIPEISWVGKTEHVLDRENINYAVGRYFFKDNIKALMRGKTDGYVKVISDKCSGDILGTHIVGSGAAEMISACTFAQKYRMKVKDVVRTSYAYYMHSVAFKRACMLANDGCWLI